MDKKINKYPTVRKTLIFQRKNLFNFQAWNLHFLSLQKRRKKNNKNIIQILYVNRYSTFGKEIKRSLIETARGGCTSAASRPATTIVKYGKC